MKRFPWILAGLVAASFSLALAQDVSYEDVDPSGQQVVFWHVHSGANQEALNQIVADFNESNEYGITVVAEDQGSYPDLFQKMLPLIGTNGMPDLILAYQNQAATYQLGDALVDMRPLIESEQWGYDEAQLDDFYESFIQSDAFPTFDNAQLGWPPNRSMEVVFFNQDWLTELGYDSFPANPEQFREVVCSASQNPFSGSQGTGSIGYEITVGASTMASWIFAFGGEVFDAQNDRYTYDSPEAIEAMTFLQELINDGCAAIETERYGAQANFGVGSTLVATGSSVGIPYYESAVEAGAGHEFDVAAFPFTGEEPVMNIYGPSVSIPNNNSPEKVVASWLFLQYYTTPEVQAEWARVSNYFPVRQSVAEDMDSYFEENPKYETAFSFLDYGKAEPATPGYDFVRNVIDDTLAEIFTGGDVEQALTALNEEANAIHEEQLDQLQ